MKSWWQVSNYIIFLTVLSRLFCKWNESYSPRSLLLSWDAVETIMTPDPLGRWEGGSSYPVRDLLKATGNRKLRWIQNYRLLLRAFLIVPFINMSFQASWKHKIHNINTSQINKRTEISVAHDAFVYVYLYTLPKQVCGHLRVPFTQIRLPEWHTCRSFTWKKYLKHDGQENNGNQIIMPQWACSVCSCEKLGFLCSVAENMPAERLREKGVPEITHISPGP